MPDLPLEHLHVEPEAPIDGPAPAAFLLHGRGATETQLREIAPLLPESMHVVSLRGPFPTDGRGYEWFDLSIRSFRRSLELASESVDAAVSAFDLDPDRLGLIGYSQGGVLSLGLLCERPERYRWVAGLHAVLSESRADCAPGSLRGIPVFLGTGDRDAVISARNTQQSADRLRELGADVTFESFDAGHETGPAERRATAEFVRRHY
jgi:phospholipase/carboxylesterase